MPLSLAYGGLLIGLAWTSAAAKRRLGSPEVQALKEPPSGECTLIQLSDLHVTDRDGRRPMGGGAPGLPEAQELADSLIGSGSP